jgi:transcriptional regulator with XRE-family HTH domain
MSARPAKKEPNPIDVEVGARIRARRLLLGMSQSSLADGLGITFQQVQKYEKGGNRVGSSRLQAIADILGVPAAFFFEQYGGVSPSPNSDDGLVGFLSSQDGLELNRAFRSIADPRVRRTFVALVKSLVTEANRKRS